MKRKWICLTGALILMAASSEAGRFVKKEFFSASLNATKNYFISYPDGYDASDPSKMYPVIIFLHGASVSAQGVVDLIEPYLSNPFTQSIFKNLYKVIYVVPDGSAPPFLGSFYTNSTLYGNYEDYIANDLTEEIKTTCHTYPMREKWSIMGHSMGGYGCMKIALKHPDDYIGVASLSAPLHTTYYDDILPLLLEEHGDQPPYEYTYQGDVTKLIYSMSGAFSPDPDSWPPVFFPVDTMGVVIDDVVSLWEPNNPIRLISKWRGDPKMAVYMYCGTLDEYRLLSQNQFFSDTLTLYGIQHEFKIDPYGDHIFSLISSLPAGINFLYNVMDTSQTEPQQVITFLKESDFLSVYPNPAQDYLYVKKATTNEIRSVRLLSITGTTLKTWTAKQAKGGMFTGDLTPGCYLLQFDVNNRQKMMLKFIKE